MYVGVKRHTKRHEYGVLRNQFYIGLRWSRSENAYAKGRAGESLGGFSMRERTPQGVPTHPNSALSLRARFCLSVWVSKSINNLYHLVHSRRGEPICTCVALQGTCAYSTFSSPIVGIGNDLALPDMQRMHGWAMNLTLIGWSASEIVRRLYTGANRYVDVVFSSLFSFF